MCAYKSYLGFIAGEEAELDRHLDHPFVVSICAALYVWKVYEGSVTLKVCN